MMRSKLCVGLIALGLSMSAMAQKVETFQDEFKQDLIDFRAAAKAAPTDAEVGDANSFGRDVKWLGLLQSGSVSFQSDCTPAPGDPPPGPDDRCVTLNAAPAATSFPRSPRLNDDPVRAAKSGFTARRRCLKGFTSPPSLGCTSKWRCGLPAASPESRRP